MPYLTTDAGSGTPFEPKPGDLAAIVDRDCLAFVASGQRAETDHVSVLEQDRIQGRVSGERIEGSILGEAGADAVFVNLEHGAAVVAR